MLKLGNQVHDFSVMRAAGMPFADAPVTSFSSGSGMRKPILHTSIHHIRRPKLKYLVQSEIKCDRGQLRVRIPEFVCLNQPTIAMMSSLVKTLFGVHAQVSFCLNIYQKSVTISCVCAQAIL